VGASGAFLNSLLDPSKQNQTPDPKVAVDAILIFVAKFAGQKKDLRRAVLIDTDLVAGNDTSYSGRIPN
jgi:hypothetical protein